MPDIPVGAQIFDLTFHPKHPTVYTALLTGEIKAFTYDEQGNYESKFSTRTSKKSCRGLTMSEDGDKLYVVGKGKTFHTIDTATGQISDTRKMAHDVAINRVKRLMPNMISTGDDDGVVKLWDPRQPESIRTHNHHFDFISDFLWLEDKKHLGLHQVRLVHAKRLIRMLNLDSGDGTLSVLDVRSKRADPFAQSEDQEDELLSVVAIKGSQKLVVGTQIGILSIFNRKSGYGDCVDRIPGHPHSVDALCNLPSSYPSAHSTVLTGSSDGLLRAVQLLPTKLLGVVADHGEFPIERIAVDMGGEGRWVGSVGHEEVLKMTDLKEVFEDDDGDAEGERDDEENDEEVGEEVGLGLGLEKALGVSGDLDDDSGVEEEEKVDDGKGKKVVDEDDDIDSDSDSEDDIGVAVDDAKDEDAEGEVDEKDEDSSDEELDKSKKRKKKKDIDPFQIVKRKKGRNEIDAEPSFFNDL
ncbi:WD repeat-containing protein jip5 [Cerrena zonata]|uniref:WD repeat-containing protein JIP5 n=1 Tax=Cerrena zonata TaxID=2478898 RepID=A0AAW0G2J4_9APHY